MASHFLDDSMDGSPEFRAEPWYNAHGDCIVYQMVNEAVVADRVDDVVTIYRSAIDDRPIGFKIKDVTEIIKRFGWDGLAVQMKANRGEVTAISINAMLLAAYEEGPKTLNRRTAYATAMGTSSAAQIDRAELIPA